MWKHTQDEGGLIQYLIRFCLAIPLGTSLLELMSVLTRHRFFLSGIPRANLQTVGHIVCIEARLPFTINVSVGQYLNVWFPFS